MRCFAKILTVSWCVLFASMLGAPTAAAADGRDASSARLSSGRPNAAQPNGTPSALTVSSQSAAAERYGDLPLSFEANHGQADGRVRFLSRGSGYSFFLTQDGAVLSFSRDSHSDATVLQMQLTGVNPNARIQGLDELPGKSNYFFGGDSRRWRTDVPTYSKVAYENVYPGISLVYYGNQRQLEYDFVVAPGADPQRIRLTVSGAQKLTVDAQGNLVLRSAAGDVQLLAPKIYQQISGQKQQVTGKWNLESNNVAGFRLGAYDRTQALVIDPVLMYSSFLGGSQKNKLSRIAIDAAGNAYVAGYTSSGDFPAAPTPMAMTFGGGAQARGAFVAKIDPSGSNLLYSTYLSGGADEEATGLAVDNSGNVYIAGNTHSTDFPTRNAFQSTCATRTPAATCSSAFLTKIGAAGNSLAFSTYLGGSGADSARSLAVDVSGNAYLAGVTSSPDFPVTAGAAQAKCGGTCRQNAFIAKFNASGDSLAYASYLGGSGTDDAADLAVDAAGNVYITGRTTSADFPLATPFQKLCTPDGTSSSAACVGTAFVTKIKADGSAFAYSTYLGGSLGSQASALAVDSSGSAYVTGRTQSADFPLLKPFQKSCGIDPASHQCSVDAFLTKLAPSGKSLVYSTYLGGSGRDEASGIVVDANGSAHIVGRTESSDFPTTASVQSTLKGTSDAFVARFNASGSKLSFSTYHGGAAAESGNAIAVDTKGNIYLTGETSSADFPTSHPFQSSCAGACTSAFVSKMALPPGVTASTTVVSTPTNPSVFGQSVTFTSATTGGSGTPTGTVDFTDGATLLATVTLDGTGTATLTTSTLTAGSHGIVTVYSGDATYASSTSATLPMTVNPATTNTSVTAAPPTSAPLGQSVTFTATMTAVAPGAGTPVGTVDFVHGVTAIAGCTSVPVNGSGTAACTTSTLAAGAYTIKATYTPIGGNFSGSNGTLPYAIVAPPSIAKAFGAASILLNASTSLTFTITNPAANTVAEAGVAFTDSLPAGLVVSTPNGLSNTCGGTATAVAGSGSISLTNGTIATSSSCTLAVNITGTATGQYTNTSGAVTSTNGGTGNTATDNLTVNSPPAITSANNTTFTVGSAGSFNVTATGFPAPTFTKTGALPAGVTLSAAGHLAGTPGAASGGDYPITITATNGVGTDATQSFTLHVTESPAITSGNSTTFAVGSAGTFTVTAAGFPAPTLSEAGALPGGVSFNNGTGVLAGTPLLGSGGVYNITFTASNGVGTPATQSFTLTVNEGPVITSSNSTTFTVGAAGTFTVTASGTPPPTYSESGALPTGVSFNAATHKIAGTPAAGTGGVYNITLGATNGFGTPASQSFTLTVNEAPAITSGNTTTFQAGVAATPFTVTATGFPVPTLSESPALPGGVNFNTGTGVLSGTPAAGTGGNHSITFTASNGVGSAANQSFALVIRDFSAIPASNSVSVIQGFASNNITFNVHSLQGYTAAQINLACAGLPGTGTPAPSCGFSSNSVALTAGQTQSPNFHVSLTGQTISSGLTTPGVYPMTVSGTDATTNLTEPASTNFTLTVVQNQPPTCGTTSASTPLVQVQQNSALDISVAATCADPEGAGVSQIDFGDGNTATGTSSPDHTYAASGSYVVAVTMTDNVQQTSTVAEGVTLAPAVNLTTSQTSGEQTLIVQAPTVASVGTVVTLACTEVSLVGVPNSGHAPSFYDIGCSFNPANGQVTLSSPASTVGITLQTSASPTTASAVTPGSRRRLAALFATGLGVPAVVFIAFGAPLVGSRRRTWRQRLLRLLPVLLLLALLLGSFGCGGGFKLPTGGGTGTTNPGAYSVTVTGTDSSNNVLTSIIIPLNVVH